jgi:hypothetical protein
MIAEGAVRVIGFLSAVGAGNRFSAFLFGAKIAISGGCDGQ